MRFELCGVLLHAGQAARAREEQLQMARLAPTHPLTKRADEILRENGV